MNPNYVVNKSGINVPVYDYFNNRIGTLYDGEAFLVYGEKLVLGTVGLSVQFLSSRGVIETGAIPYTEEKYRRPMQDYPYGKVDIFGNGYMQDVFKMRRVENIYTATGRYWGQVAAGCLVRVNPFICGENRNECCQITYVQKSNGTWQKVDGDGYDYGFIDVGLNHGSFNYNISMYGSW